jgi:prophage regulatory protein
MTTKKTGKTPEQGTGVPVSPLEPSQPLGAASVPGSLLRIATVTAVTGLSKRTIYRMMDKGDFPDLVRLTPRCVAWRQADVAAWITSRSGA